MPLGKKPILTSLQLRRLKELLHRAYGHREHGRRALFMHEAEGLNARDHWIEPSFAYSQLSQFVGEVMRKDHYNRGTVIALLRELGAERGLVSETFLYGGCWHGDDPDRVDRLFETRVDFAFFSDITGSDRVEESKRIFYNEIVNPSYLLKKTSDKKEKEVLERKIGRGLRKLEEWVCRWGIDNKMLKRERIPKPALAACLPAGRRVQHDIRVEDILSYKNHGEWMASLPKKTRQKILQIVKEDTISFIHILDKLRRRGTRVIVVEGNWDNSRTLELVAKGVGEREDKVSDYFNTKNYVRKYGFEFYDYIKGIETSTAYHILAPFFWLRNMEKYLKDRNSREKVKKVQMEVDIARSRGKTIVMYAHGIPYPAIHDISANHHMVVSPDNRIVSENLRYLMVLFRPAEVVYPHYHAEPKVRLWANVGRGGAPLVWEKKNLQGVKRLAQVDYVPFRDVAIKRIRERFHIP